MAFRTSSPLEQATEQVADSATDAADLVADVLTDVANSAAELVAESGEALVAASASSLIGMLKRPKALLAILIVAALGAWAYRRFVASDDSMDDAIDDVPSLQR